MKLQAHLTLFGLGAYALASPSAWRTLPWPPAKLSLCDFLAHCLFSFLSLALSEIARVLRWHISHPPPPQGPRSLQHLSAWHMAGTQPTAAR